MVRYMAENGENYSPDSANVIIVNEKRYSIRGFLSPDTGIRYLEDGIPLVGGKRLYNKETGKLNFSLQKEASGGSTLVAILIDEESKRLAPISKESILLKKIKRVI